MSCGFRFVGLFRLGNSPTIKGIDASSAFTGSVCGAANEFVVVGAARSDGCPATVMHLE